MKRPAIFLALLMPFFLPAIPALGGETGGPRRVISLDGEWSFRRDGGKEWKPVQVPSSFQDHEGTDFHGVGWYKKKLPPIDLPSGKRVLLHFQAAATEAEVSLDGKKLGSHLGGWTPFRFDVTEEIRKPAPEGGHEVQVRLDEKVGHNTQGFLTIIEPHFGGIWQSVRLLIMPDPYIDDLNLKAIGDPDTGKIEIESPVVGAASGASVSWRLRGAPSFTESQVPAIVESGVLRLSLPIPDAKRWSPGEPNLYDVRIGLSAGGDQVLARAAFRKVKTSEDKILLNGIPLNVRGVLNWGYYPPRNYPRLDEERFRKDLEFARASGFNLMKFCLWVPPKRYLEMADEFGLLTWMEYPTWHPQLTGKHLEDLRKEFTEFFAYDRNHPSVILRSLTCETGSGAELSVIQALYDQAHRMVPGALVEDDSSWIGWNRINDFYDDHPYGNNHTWVATLRGLREHIEKRKRTLPLVLGEAIAADTWVPREPVVNKTGDARPFWVPGFFDEGAKWVERMRALYGSEGLDRLVPDSMKYCMLMRKYQAEAFRREIPAGGYVISVIRDFSTAAMGLIDYLDQPKWGALDWSWQGDTMILLKTENDRRSFVSGERLKAEVLVSHFGRQALERALLFVTLKWTEKDSSGKVMSISQDSGSVVKVLDFDSPLPEVSKPTGYLVLCKLRTKMEDFQNSWPIWVVPKPEPVPPGIVIASKFDDKLVKVLGEGGKVLLRPDGEKDSLPLNAHWFLRGAPYVPGSALSAAVPRDLLVELQHFDLASDVIPEISYLDEIDPILLLWDTHDLKAVKTHGLIFETGAGKGRLLVSAVRHDGPTNSAGQWLLGVLANHLASGPPPKKSLKDGTWQRLKEKLHEETISLAKETWNFKPDPKDEGLAKGWHLPSLALDEGWKDIKVGRSWESQGWPDLDGWAWYRLSVTIPAGWAGREAYLSFEGVDDLYELYVNGKLAGKGGDLATKKDAFSEKKSHPISSFTKPGEPCLIAVRVHDWYGAGGIHQPVSLGTAAFIEGPEILKR